MNNTNPDTNNQTAPGDSCSNSSECFGATGVANCTDNVCTTASDENTVCDDDRWCVVGMYCASGKCANQSDEGEVCSAPNMCKTGLACSKNMTGTAAADYTCQKFYSYNPGESFDPTYVLPRANLFDANSMCSTHEFKSISDTNKTCITATVSRYNSTVTEDDLKRPDGPAGDCTYTAYDENGTATDGQDSATCGFNKDDAAYCNKRKGDSWFTTALEAIKGPQSQVINCHISSGLYNCPAYIAALGGKNDTAITYGRELQNTEHWSNYANNGKCVAESITASYWQGNSPDFAFNSLSMTSLASIMLAVTALFYMF